MPPASMTRVATVASTFGVQSTIDVPFVHGTPARAILSFNAIVRPLSKSLVGAAALAVT